MKRTKEALKWIVSILKKHKIPYQITGGFAAKIYGSKRPLWDIDIAIPEKDFQKILPEVKKQIQFGPEKIMGKKFRALCMGLKYKGQVIEIDGAKTKVFDRKTEKWRSIKYDFSKSEVRKIYSMNIPVIPKELLIKYKKVLSRRVDLQDIKDLS